MKQKRSARPSSTARAIMRAALLVEGLLVAIFVLWSQWRGVTVPNPLESWAVLLWGLLWALPLLVVNALLFLLPCGGPFKGPLHSCQAFVRDIVTPMARELPWFPALCVSILAGVGEESFFRGVLQHELGIIVSAIAFSLMHFGRAVIRFPTVSILYVGFGLYFSLIVVWQGLWVAVVAHAAYDWFALLALHYLPLGGAADRCGRASREDSLES